MERRMLEAGTRFVTVLWHYPDGYNWDNHRTSDDLRYHFLPGLNQALSALLKDMSDRGLLDETLVVCCGEIGRTPRPDTDQWGRGHWSYCFPAVLAATVFRALEISPDTRIYDAQDRSVLLAADGRPLRDLFG